MSKDGCYVWRDYNDLDETQQFWLVDTLLPLEGSGILAGPPKCRKSYLALQLSLALAHGTPWLGFKTRKARVLYLQLDTSRMIWKLRIRNLIRMGVTVSDEANENLIMADLQGAPFPFNILRDKPFAWLKQRCAEYAPQLVIIDTMSKAHAGDEDKRGDMERVMTQFQEAVRPSAILFLTHERKASDEEAGSGIARVRGSSAITAGVDLIMSLKPRTAKSGARLTVKGRACEDMTLDLASQPSLFFEANEEVHWVRLVRNILASHGVATAETARILFRTATESGIKTTQDACYKRLRRAIGHEN